MRIIGHRGARAEAPENTLGAFEFALQHNIRHFELDLRLSLDGVPMVIHDADTARTCGRELAIAEATAIQLQQLDAAMEAEWHQAEPVPTLAQLLPLLEQAKSVQLEIKSDHPARLSPLIQATRDLLRGKDRERYTLTSFDRRALALARQLAPDLRRGLVCERRFVDNIGIAQRHGCELIVYHYRIVAPRQLERARSSGLEVSCYTVNDLAQVKKLKDWGVDSIITDHPVKYLHLQD